MDQKDIKICRCFRCNDPSKIACFENEAIGDPKEFAPTWIQNSTYYERQSENEVYGLPVNMSCFKHYFGVIVHKLVDYNGVTSGWSEIWNLNVVSSSNTLEGRMASKILVFDLLRKREIELTLRNTDTNTDFGSSIQLTRKQLCELWPSHFMIIDETHAILLLRNQKSEDSFWFMLMMIETNYEFSDFVPKDSILVYDNPSQKAYLYGRKNLAEDNCCTPLCSLVVANSRVTQNLVRGDTIFTLFVSFDRSQQKLCLLKKVPGNMVNWHKMFYDSLINQKLYHFDVGRSLNSDGSFRAYLMNFTCMHVYDLDEPEKGLQAKKLVLPAGNEQILVNRFNSNVIKIVWNCDQIILCIRGIGLLDDVINVFMLDFSLLNWRKIYFECPAITPRLKIDPYSSIFSQYTWFSDQVLTCNSIHKQYDGKTWKTAFRWYRTHIRRPASLLELSWLQGTQLNYQLPAMQF